MPVTTTLVPTGPDAGVKLVTVGAGTTVKFDALVAVPPGVVMLIVPVVAPLGTVAVICVSLTTVNDADPVPLKLTPLVPVKPVPVSVTVAPTRPIVGVKPVSAGGTQKSAVLTAVPPGVVTVKGPLIMALGEVALIVVSLTTVNDDAAVPSKLTAVAPVRPVPVTVTTVPAGP